MDDLSDLYQDIILSHNKRPRNEGKPAGFNHQAEGFNPLCGDRIEIYVQEDGDRLSLVRFAGEGCAISRASASIMTENVSGLSEAEARQKTAEILSLLTGKDELILDLAEHGDLAALAGVRKFPARIKCATLAWHTLIAALENEKRVSTEEA